MFSAYGTVLSVRIMVEKGSGRSRGFGFVSFDSQEVRLPTHPPTHPSTFPNLSACLLVTHPHRTHSSSFEAPSSPLPTSFPIHAPTHKSNHPSTHPPTHPPTSTGGRNCYQNDGWIPGGAQTPQGPTQENGWRRRRWRRRKRKRRWDDGYVRRPGLVSYPLLLHHHHVLDLWCLLFSPSSHDGWGGGWGVPLATEGEGVGWRTCESGAFRHLLLLLLLCVLRAAPASFLLLLLFFLLPRRRRGVWVRRRRRRRRRRRKVPHRPFLLLLLLLLLLLPHLLPRPGAQPRRRRRRHQHLPPTHLLILPILRHLLLLLPLPSSTNRRLPPTHPPTLHGSFHLLLSLLRPPTHPPALPSRWGLLPTHPPTHRPSHLHHQHVLSWPRRRRV